MLRPGGYLVYWPWVVEWGWGDGGSGGGRPAPDLAINLEDTFREVGEESCSNVRGAW